MIKKEFSSVPIDPSEITRCLEEKIGALKEYLSLTESLKEKLDIQEMNEAKALLAKRKDLISFIDGLNEKISKIQSGRPLGKKNLSRDLQDRMDSLFETVRELLKKISALDKACQTQMIACQQETKNELSNMRDGLTILHNYIPKPSLAPRFMDVQG